MSFNCWSSGGRSNINLQDASLAHSWLGVDGHLVATGFSGGSQHEYQLVYRNPNGSIDELSDIHKAFFERWDGEIEALSKKELRQLREVITKRAASTSSGV